MDTYDLSHFLDSTRLKSTRRKKQLVKKDFEKQLTQLFKTENKLWKERNNLPFVPLEKPYQKGWERSFFLREDVARLSNAAFYKSLLDKINTYQYSQDKSFKKRKRKYRKYVFHEKPHLLEEFSECEWASSKLKLSEKEKTLFEKQEVWCIFKKAFKVSYVFKESWRFVLKIKPNIITHKKMIDEVLEQELAEIDNYIVTNHLRNKISKLKSGYAKYKYYMKSNPKYQNPFKNIKVYDIYHQYIDEKF
jgi:hypothetical protein